MYQSRHSTSNIPGKTHILVSALLLLSAFIAGSGTLRLRGTVLVAGDRARLAQQREQSRLRILESLNEQPPWSEHVSHDLYSSTEKKTHDNMLCLVFFLEKVEIMVKGVRLISREINSHLELTPSLLLNPERRLLEDYFVR
jgi:hypothetical protein